MTESFLHLSDNERHDIYTAGANSLGRAPVVLEKDVWVCWSLAVLFGTTDRLPMAFKGGTALSKAHHAIDRFSEDIDVTVQVPSAATLDKDDLPTSSNKRKALATHLNGELREYITDQLLPLFIAQLAYIPGGGRVLQQGESMEELIIAYPTCFGALSALPYMAQQIKLEFGARNLIDPRTIHRIEPYIAGITLEAPLEFPVAHEVEVLGLERIFWEKATLAHDHCNRNVDETGSAERISRHWYDLAVLTEQGVAARAHGRRDQLSSVIRIKNVFYKRSTSDYDACLANGLKLVPDAKRLVHLRADYAAMTSANMFVEEPRSFDEIIETLRGVETLLNA